MAERGEYSNSVKGSDACFEYTCTPCAEEDNSQEALKYCPECKEYLCAECMKYHQKVSATKKHTLYGTDFQQGRDDSGSATDDKMFKCLYHPDRDIEMYCGSDKMVYCCLCIAKEHRQCRGILELEEAAKQIPVNKDDVKLLQIDCLKADIQTTRQKKIDNLNSLEQEKSDILKAIEDMEHLIIDKAKELASDAKAKASMRYEDLKCEIQKDISVLSQAIVDATEIRNKLKTQEELDAKRQFARHIIQKFSIEELHLINDGVEKVKKKMKCSKNNKLLQQVMSADYIVQIIESKTRFDAESSV